VSKIAREIFDMIVETAADVLRSVGGIIAEAVREKEGYWFLINPESDANQEGLHIPLGIRVDQLRSLYQFLFPAINDGKLSPKKAKALAAEVSKAIDNMEGIESREYEISILPYRRGEGFSNDLFLRLGKKDDPSKQTHYTRAGKQYKKGRLVATPQYDIHYRSLTANQKQNIQEYLIMARLAIREESNEDSSNNPPPPDPRQREKDFISTVADELASCFHVSNIDNRTKARVGRKFMQLFNDFLQLKTEMSEVIEDEEVVDPFDVIGATEDERMSVDIGPLLSRLNLTRTKRTIVMPSHNGRQSVLIVRPYCKDVKSFLNEARRSQWVESAFDTPEQRQGIISWMMMYHREDAISVMKKKDLKIFEKQYDTYDSEAVAGELGMNKTELENFRSMAKREGLKYEHKRDEKKIIEDQAGLRSETKPTFGTHKVYRKGKVAEEAHFWVAQIKEDMCTEVEMHMMEQQLEHAEQNRSWQPPVLDYHPAGMDEPGINLMWGGDHGKGFFRMFEGLQLTSSEYRVEEGDMSKGCPQLQVAAMLCKKDTYEVLRDTVMPKINKAIKELKKSSMLYIYDVRNPATKCKAFIVPKSIDVESVSIAEDGRVSYCFENKNNERVTRVHELPESRKPNPGEHHFYKSKIVISAFQQFLRGDNAFLCCCKGMKNSSSKWCGWCEAACSNFNVPSEMKKRTPESTKRNREEYEKKHNEERERKRQRKEKGEKKVSEAFKTRNVKGVNEKDLLDIDKVLVPILHLPMGTNDKVLRTVEYFIHVFVLKYDDPTLRAIRDRLRKAEIAVMEAIMKYAEFDRINDGERRDIEEFNRMKAQKKVIKKCKEERSAARKQYREVLLPAAKAMSDGFHARMERILKKKYGITPAAYHGGSYTGVCTIRYMGNASGIFKDMQFLLIDEELFDPEIAEESYVRQHLRQFEHLVGNSDVIWSSIRGIKGLLPSAEHMEELEEALETGKRLWLAIGIGTEQPKWHATHYHTIEQMKDFGGLADKSEEPVEHGHQVYARWDGAYARLSSNFEKWQLAVRKAERKSRHPVVKKRREKLVASKKKHSVKSNRKQKAISEAAKREEEKQAKREEYRKYPTFEVKRLFWDQEEEDLDEDDS
jgi:hypothetical protein